MLVLGDEGVGKSSLISTFVSRHFSEVVPGIMTRVRLPPDPENSCITTIVDSQGGDAALISAVANMATTGATASLPTSPANASITENESMDRGNLDISTVATSPSMSLSMATTPGSNFLRGNSYGNLASIGNSSLREEVPMRSLARPNGMGGIENVDSIILIYDLDRDETFFRLENHWLPLIERCFNGELPVIVAGNKMDLFLPSSTAGVTDEQVLARSRQQIVSLMQRFRFIRQCIKCSAKNLLRVDEVFLKAQQAVLYPFVPLYDLDIGRLSEDCQRAFTRIFRMYDRDHDGLLSHSELDRFQHETFHVPVYERDLTGWKKVVTRNNPNEEVVREGKFTVAGFLAIFDVFISQNRLDVPWQALRSFGYDDHLNLKVPLYLYGRPGDMSWSLTSSSRKFLSDLFHQFDSDHDGVLSLDDMDAIFSILPDPSLPPWHPIRSRELFGESFSRPIMPYTELPTSESAGSTSSLPGMSLAASGITIISNESYPSLDVSSIDRAALVSTPLAYLDWMGLWHNISAISPGATRAELFRLGHIEDTKTSKKRGRKKSVAPLHECTPDSILPSRELRLLLLGSPSSGKTALINSLCNGRTKDPLKTTKTTRPETTNTFVRMKRRKTKSSKGEVYETIAVHLIITEIPEAEAENRVLQRKQISEILHNGGCDLVVLAFDSTNSASLAYAKHLEGSSLTEGLARVFVATKSDQCMSTNDQDEEDDEDWKPKTVIDEAAMHCRELDIEPPLITSASEAHTAGHLGEQNRTQALTHFARCALKEEPGIEPLRAKPHEEQKRREAAKRRNRKMIWFGVGVGVAAAVVGYLWTGGVSGSKGASDTSTGGDRRVGRLGWFRSFFARAQTPLVNETMA
eukprot:CAMPEP_0116087976 /NCGR_PEP_ID=MMETSP0327-20121206/5635_1 /TAXON_ID=44447 /ORGANISM="Pseudo-nitzschia delicatissima, Strain B596" /LENGTH=862 /DNA_ID=CAMNT_0003579049 /DNA_START=382 /DNA_END=2970 /DNA_ORIENTATION=-